MLIVFPLVVLGFHDDFGAVWGRCSGPALDGGAIVVSGEKTWTSREGKGADSLIPACSVTKLMTAQVVMQLVDEGRLRFDERVRTQLKWLPAFCENVTVEQLLTHTSGLRNMDVARTEKSADGVPLIYFDTSEAVRPLRKRILLALGERPAHNSGEAYDYNNLDFLVLQALIETVEGCPFETSLKRRVLAPAGMSRTRMAPWGRLPKSGVRSYQTVEGRRVSEERFNFGIYGASGGVLTTLADVGRWMRWSLAQSATRSPLAAGSRFGGFQGYGGYAYVSDALGERQDVFERPGAIACYGWQLSFLPKQGIAVAAYAINDGASLGSVFEKKGLVVDLLKVALDEKNPFAGHRSLGRLSPSLRLNRLCFRKGSLPEP